MRGDVLEAVETASEAAGMAYELHAMGDVNGDGRGDYAMHVQPLPENSEDPEDHIPTLVMVSGADHAPLWSLSLEGAYWYPANDVDGDGALDAILYRPRADGEAGSDFPSTPVSDSWAYESRAVAEVVSGANGNPLFDVELRMRFEDNYVDAPTGAYWDSTWAFEWLQALPDATGVDLVKYELRVTFADALSLWYMRWGNDYEISRYDGSGQRAWTAQFAENYTSYYMVDRRDITGDGIPDYLFAFQPSDDVYYLFASSRPAMEALIGYGAILIDGADGNVAWKTRAPIGTEFALPLPAGRIHDDHRDVLLLQSNSGLFTPPVVREQIPENAPVDPTTRIDVLNGRDGTVREGAGTTLEGSHMAFEFGDVDGDGRDEMLKFEIGDGEELIGATVVDAAWRPVWPAPVAAGIPAIDEQEFDLYGFQTLDFDGDRVPDLPFVTYDEIEDDGFVFLGAPESVTFRSGRTGEALWTLAFTDQTIDVSFVEDANGDGGRDVVVTRFQVPDGTSDSWECCDEPDDAPVDYANYAAYVDLLRGADGARIWTRQVYDPKPQPIQESNTVSFSGFGASSTSEQNEQRDPSEGAEGNQTGYGVGIIAQSLPDTNGNAGSEILFTLRSFGAFDCDFDGDEVRCEEYGIEGELLNFALVVDGPSGDLLKTYGDGFLTGPALLGPAGAPLQLAPKPPLLPGFEPGIAVLAFALLAYAGARRRRGAP